MDAEPSELKFRARLEKRVYVISEMENLPDTKIKLPLSSQLICLINEDNVLNG
jgi:hypothetical protein